MQTKPRILVNSLVKLARMKVRGVPRAWESREGAPSKPPSVFPMKGTMVSYGTLQLGMSCIDNQVWSEPLPTVLRAC